MVGIEIVGTRRVYVGHGVKRPAITKYGRESRMVDNNINITIFIGSDL